MTQSSSDILKDEALQRLIHATSGNATTGDLQELQAWRARSPAHREAYRYAIGMWQSLETAARESITPEDRRMIAGEAHAKAVMARRAFLIGSTTAAAATLAVGVVRPPFDLWPSLPDLMADYRTGAGESRSVALADGLTVDMNTRTSVAHRSSEDGREIIELLSGEAAITAAQGASRPLTVIAGDGRVLATRAQANMRYDAGMVHVACLQGVVEVECRAGRATLRAGEQLGYAGEKIGTVATADQARITAWQKGLLIFRDEPLARVVDEVNRYWRGRIVLLNADLGDRRVTVRLELARIAEVVSYVEAVLGANVRTLPGGVVILT